MCIASLAAETARGGEGRFLGPFGPEGPRLREQFWVVPTTDSETPMRATVFRPADDEADDRRARNVAAGGAAMRRPLVVINHGTSEATRLSVSMPVYYWLSHWFVDRGYVVLLPQRRGHGATGGALAESIGTCADPDHFRSGLAAAADIEAAVRYMQAQPFVDPDNTVVVGISSGGWASLALAARNPRGVRAVISFAGGRGGRAFGRTDGSVCGEERLIAAAGAYGAHARVPTLWLYAENDSYFHPPLARALAKAWRAGGGSADLEIFAPYGSDGHTLVDDRAGWDIWGHVLESFLTERRGAPVATLGQPAPAGDGLSVVPAADDVEPHTAELPATAAGGQGTN